MLFRSEWGTFMNEPKVTEQSFAYELAEKLDWHWDNDCRSPAISKSADMLRSQSELIASLQESNRQQADRIKELEQALSRALDLLGAPK